MKIKKGTVVAVSWLDPVADAGGSEDSNLSLHRRVSYGAFLSRGDDANGIEVVRITMDTYPNVPMSEWSGVGVQVIPVMLIESVTEVLLEKVLWSRPKRRKK